MNQEKIGKFIALLRKEKHLTQEQFAEKLGVNHRSISRWETGESMPDVSLLQVISDELGVSIAELLDGQRVYRESYFVKEECYRRNYEILIETTRKEAAGEEISEDEKREIVEALLCGVACKEDVLKYKKSMRVNPVTDKIYPEFFLPPYNGKKKLPLVQGYMPKTHILYGNHMELELLRLLHLFAPDNEEVQRMVEHTLERLRETCFGTSCLQGECFAAGISVLRFLKAVRPEETEWIEKLRGPLEEYLRTDGVRPPKMRNDIPVSYLKWAFQDIER